MKITQTNGNSKNGIRGSRLRFYNKDNKLVGELIVPTNNAKHYCQKYINGKYGKEYHRLVTLIEKGE